MASPDRPTGFFLTTPSHDAPLPIAGPLTLLKKEWGPAAILSPDPKNPDKISINLPRTSDTFAKIGEGERTVFLKPGQQTTVEKTGVEIHTMGRAENIIVSFNPSPSLA